MKHPHVWLLNITNTYNHVHNLSKSSTVMSDPGCVSSQSHGVCAAPGVKQQRLQVIRDKIRARDELLSRPQRFASSRPLSRREIEIEQALFQGNDRLGFLTALYHRGTERRRHCLQRGGMVKDTSDRRFITRTVQKHLDSKEAHFSYLTDFLTPSSSDFRYRHSF